MLLCRASLSYDLQLTQIVNEAVGIRNQIVRFHLDFHTHNRIPKNRL